ncbi:MAG: glycogen debranching enzyme GlgX, partial [Planctomycetaceae bacterium]|nr:glycogen debranching enzyme GlgX [Planctomycetaceae bacterium]
QGRSIRGKNVRDITWLTPNGKVMTNTDWHEPHVRCLAVRFEGDQMDEVDERGRQISGHSFLMLLNAHNHSIDFTLPAHKQNEFWKPLVDTSDVSRSFGLMRQGQVYRVTSHSMVVLRLKTVASKMAARLISWMQPEMMASSLFVPEQAEAQPEQKSAEETQKPTDPQTSEEKPAVVDPDPTSVQNTLTEPAAETKSSPAAESVLKPEGQTDPEPENKTRVNTSDKPAEEEDSN